MMLSDCSKWEISNVELDVRKHPEAWNKEGSGSGLGFRGLGV